MSIAKNFWQKLNKPILALAPMAGITDSAFRQICRKYGADVVYSEMASASALFFHPTPKLSFSNRTNPKNLVDNKKPRFWCGVKPAKTLELIRFNKKERPYIVQLFGKDPEHFAVAAKIITEKIKPDGIDINFGCPAKKVFGHGSGCALMPNIKLAREIISAVCENTSLPVSIKVRAGIESKDAINRAFTTAIEFIEKTKDLPYSAVMIHGRTYEGGFSGAVDWEIISKIKKIIPDKIVLGNGGILTPADALEVFKKYPDIDGLGIARGAWGRPYIFDEIKNDLHSQNRSSTPISELNSDFDFIKIKKIMIEHAKLIWQDKKELGMFEIRKHLVWYIKGFPGAAELRKKLVRAESVGEIREILNH